VHWVLIGWIFRSVKSWDAGMPIIEAVSTGFELMISNLNMQIGSIRPHTIIDKQIVTIITMESKDKLRIDILPENQISPD
jgi:hypothetical protein